MGSYQRHPSHNPAYERLKQLLIQIFLDKYTISAQIFDGTCDSPDSAKELATNVTCYIIEELESDIQCEQVDENLASKVFGDKKEEIFTLIKQLVGETNEETQNGLLQETQHDMSDVTVSASNCLMNKMAGYIQNDLNIRFKGGFTCKVVDLPMFERLKQTLIQLFHDKYKIPATERGFIYFVFDFDEYQNYSNLDDNAGGLATLVTRYMFKELQSDIQCEQVDESLASKVFGDKKDDIFTLIKQYLGKSNEETQDGGQQETLHDMSDVTVSASKCLMNKMAGYIQNDLRVTFNDGLTCKVVDFPMFERLKQTLIQIFHDKYKIQARKPCLFFCLLDYDGYQNYSDLEDDAEGLATLVRRYMFKALESEIQCEQVDVSLAFKVFGEKKEEILTLIKQLVGETNEETQSGRQVKILHDMGDVTFSASNCLMNKMAVYIQNDLRVRFKDGFTCKVVEFPLFERLKQTLIQLLRDKYKIPVRNRDLIFFLKEYQKYLDYVDNVEGLATLVMRYMIKEWEQVDEKLASKVFGQEKQKIFTLMKQFFGTKYSSQSTTFYNVIREFDTQILMNEAARYIQSTLVDYLTRVCRVGCKKMIVKIVPAKEWYSRQLAIFTFCAFKDGYNVSNDKQAFRILKQSKSSMCAFLCPPHVYLRGGVCCAKSLRTLTQVAIRL